MGLVVDIPCTVKQREFLYKLLKDPNADVVIYGGARGGGKTFISCLAMVLRRLMYPRTRGLMIRRTQSAADQNLKQEIEKVLYDCLKIPRGAIQYKVNDKTFVFPNGATIKLGYCKLNSDYEQYMGTEYADIDFEELTQHPRDAWQKVGGSNRSNNPDCRAKRYGTCNPGGQGHSWVKEDYIDAETRQQNTEFIRALAHENLALLVNDPGYVKRVLDPLPEWQRRQWKDGDWDALSGGYFSLPPYQIVERVVPYYADWVGGVDWGRAAPFCTLWIARWQDLEGNFHAHVVSELYRRGLELDEQAESVLEIEEGLVKRGILNVAGVRYYADPSVAKPLEGERVNAGRTVRRTWANYGFYVLPAHTNARVPGWQLIRLLLKQGILTIDPSCRALIREIKDAIYEGTAGGGEPSGEDIDEDNCPDHALDALRYSVVSSFGLDFKAEQVNPWEIAAKNATSESIL